MHPYHVPKEFFETLHQLEVIHVHASFNIVETLLPDN